ncbi:MULTISPECIES: hypothetical protein [Legionella]|uniref:Toxin n=1 Tax=Legionella maceachernii TaxID=466 RepID=A0A0W0VWG4_9GAMM|nr:hypothetical protein [Legionella maceachernii]KTD24592.1 hypothetical protein Lmac_2679 [Legionella maceachernii]SJZ63489.1 hypothetical protein SAMN02745128_00670 [Legionella maceachernii]SUP01052.1 Uncharacterised protein [Legionella maceachernii]
MKFRYDEAKNANLLTTRGIGFEEIILEIKNGNLIDILEHHNQAKYPNQKIMQIRCLGKIYCVPYVKEMDGSLFLKTLYPSRKATKKYL